MSSQPESDEIALSRPMAKRLIVIGAVLLSEAVVGFVGGAFYVFCHLFDPIGPSGLWDDYLIPISFCSSPFVAFTGASMLIGGLWCRHAHNKKDSAQTTGGFPVVPETTRQGTSDGPSPSA